MLLTTRRARQLLLAGLATALFSGIGLASVAAAEPDFIDRAPEAVSTSAADEPLPGRDSTVPGVAFGLLLGSAGLAWVVRRSAPASAAVARVAEVPPRRHPAGTKPTTVPRPAAA